MPAASGDHLSGNAIAGALWRPTRMSDGTSSPVTDAADMPPPHFHPAWPCSWRGLPGWRHYCHHRWSLTPPFHPRPARRPGNTPLCCTIPSGRPVRPLAGAMLRGVRTFLDLTASAKGNEKPRPPGQLDKRIVTLHPPRVKQHPLTRKKARYGLRPARSRHCQYSRMLR